MYSDLIVLTDSRWLCWLHGVKVWNGLMLVWQESEEGAEGHEEGDEGEEASDEDGNLSFPSI